MAQEKFAKVQFASEYDCSKKGYTYRIPVGLSVSVGDIVQVPLNGGKRKMTAVVGGVCQERTCPDDVTVYDIIKVVNSSKDTFLNFIEICRKKCKCFSD